MNNQCIESVRIKHPSIEKLKVKYEQENLILIEQRIYMAYPPWAWPIPSRVKNIKGALFFKPQGMIPMNLRLETKLILNLN